MGDELTDAVTAVIHRAPEWLRHDLNAKDEATRTRAEEALALMVAAALRDTGSPSE